MKPASSIRDLIVEAAQRDAQASALIATDGVTFTYGALVDRIDGMVADLRARGVGATERIALVLPNGISAALAFLAGASASIACPLNPASRRADLDFAFDDLQTTTLVTDTAFDSPAVAAALARGMRVIDVGELGTRGTPPTTCAAAPAAPALILHTSGTTAKPKMVPLTHANLCASATNIARWLELGHTDRCLNIMPLFHIHGLVAGLLASLAAGASIVCSAGFVAPDFFAQSRTHRPTWYTAVPTMHQSIVARAQMEPAPAALRFVRSSSAPLAQPTAIALAELFAAPVVEAYGMTEAAHQMCSNPIARGAQRYGSVGVPTGTEVAIIDVHGAVVPSGAVGEIVIRGEGVTAGYIADASVNAAAFARGWFRTGDLGRFDADGYLYLEGRIKELINRGGEKISPREIDDVLMSHPGVAQAVAFPIPDARLGEEVGAAVVLTSGALIDERTLIEFAAERLAEWKIPRRVAIVAELPTGPTGKLMRTGLAERLDLHASVVPLGSHLSTPQATLFMDLLAAIWCDVLKVPSVDVVADADFLALGGDSLMAAQVIARVRNECGRELSILAFFDHPTLSSMAAAIAESPPVAASVLNARYMASID